MANQNLNPLSRLLDIDFPDIKRSNWNNSFDSPTTADVGFVNVVMNDHVMAGARCTLDFNSASFANATKAPLYGRYKVKYLAIWAPDRLYMSDWLSGEKMEDDDYPYPTFDPNQQPFEQSNVSYGVSSSSGMFLPAIQTLYENVARPGTGFVNPTSLIEDLEYFPSYFHADLFDSVPKKNAFSLLAFWDAYRNFIMNPQEGGFPIRVAGFKPEQIYSIVDSNDDSLITGTFAAESPKDVWVTTDEIDQFFKDIKRNASRDALDIDSSYYRYFHHSILAPKRVFPISGMIQSYTDGSNNLNRLWASTPSNFDLVYDFHYGKPIAPYMADPFTSFISNANVELEKSKSTVYTSQLEKGVGFTMEQWYIASRIQSKVRKNLFKFQDFATWIDTNFGVKPSTTLTQPMFLGAFSSDIIFNDAVSTTQQSGGEELGSNRNLGDRAGYGVGRDGDRSNFFDFTAQEPGTVMVLQWIVPETHYFEGCAPFHDTLNFNEEYNPIFDAVGFQDMRKSTLNIVPNLQYDPYGRIAVAFPRLEADTMESSYIYEEYDTAIAQQPYAFEHMCRPNKLKGMMTMPNYYQDWTLARSFNYNRGDIRFVNADGGTLYTQFPNRGPLGSYSTYIVPEMYNNIFSNGQYLDNFQFYLSFDYKKYQPLSKQFLSFT